MLELEQRMRTTQRKKKKKRIKVEMKEKEVEEEDQEGENQERGERGGRRGIAKNTNEKNVYWELKYCLIKRNCFLNSTRDVTQWKRRRNIESSTEHTGKPELGILSRLPAFPDDVVYISLLCNYTNSIYYEVSVFLWFIYEYCELKNIIVQSETWETWSTSTRY